MTQPELKQRPPRVVVEAVEPVVDGGRFPIKRLVGQTLQISADVFADGHDEVGAHLHWRHESDAAWQSLAMRSLGNDRWQSEFVLERPGRYLFTVEGRINAVGTWLHDLRKRIAAGQDVTVDLEIGAGLVGQAAERARTVGRMDDAKRLQAWRSELANGKEIVEKLHAEGDALAELADRYPSEHAVSLADREFAVVVDRALAGCSAWYEMFPRSCAAQPGKHGTFADCAARLPYVAEMGFNILYLPPIHPVGNAFRKGRNNALEAAADDPGSPWGIGSAEGGHKAIHSQLGTLEDFRALVREARRFNIEIALDIAYQCSPDHPYVSEHPDWFRQRPDGTIQYAENPPKKYQDIYPFDFDTQNWRALWAELRDVVLFWIGEGVRIFRVDNPHTKPFAFWEWLISDVKQKHPDVIFLSEAFTRPKVMYQLAKLGFTQSYTYFTWRNTKSEFIEYFTELTTSPVREFFRPNLWPNTPDILPEHLQTGGRAAFVSRLVLAATLSPNYGIYGPAFELGEHVPREPGSEEYLYSEKYEIRHWDLERPDSLRKLIARVNRARHENAALQAEGELHFHEIENEQLLCYSKRHRDGNLLLAVVSLEFHQRQGGYVHLPLAELGLPQQGGYLLRDLLTDADFHWQGPRNYVELDPAQMPAHLFCVERP